MSRDPWRHDVTIRHHLATRKDNSKAFVYICLKTCKRQGSKSYFGSQSKCVICVAWYIHGYRRGIKTKPHLLLHIFHDTSLTDPAWKPLPLRGRGFHAGRLVKYHGKYATAMWFCVIILRRPQTLHHWQKVSFGDKSIVTLYPSDERIRVCRLHGERFCKDCQAVSTQVVVVGYAINIWRVFQSATELPLSPLDAHMNVVWYRNILQNIFVVFAKQHFHGNFRYHNVSTTAHRARKFTASSETGHHQDGAASEVTWLQPHKTWLGRIEACLLYDRYPLPTHT